MAAAAAAAGDPTEHALERLRRCASALPSQEQPPELVAILTALEGMQKAEEWLGKAAEHLGPPPADVVGPAFEARQEASQASTELMLVSQIVDSWEVAGTRDEEGWTLRRESCRPCISLLPTLMLLVS